MSQRSVEVIADCRHSFEMCHNTFKNYYTNLTIYYAKGKSTFHIDSSRDTPRSLTRGNTNSYNSHSIKEKALLFHASCLSKSIYTHHFHSLTRASSSFR